MRNLFLFILLIPFFSCKKESTTAAANADCSISPWRVGTRYDMLVSNGRTLNFSFEKDTLIDGKNFFKTQTFSLNTGEVIGADFVRVDANGDVYECACDGYTIIAKNVLVVKVGQSIGTIWDYTSPAIGNVSYYLTFKISSKTETATIDSKKYSNGFKVETLSQRLVNGVPSGSGESAIITYFCGLGITSRITSTYSSGLKNYVY